ncbi:MAG: TIGR03663 family protein [Lentisphaeraceae bacterium]|nr:TIGR03663 family protein [Lentisphaeraceae bacterium]
MIDKSRNIWFYLIFAALLCLGLFLRLKDIDTRPMHGDEANQAATFQKLFESGEYTYEARDYHGPTLYYLTVPFVKICGLVDFAAAQKWHFRGLTVFFMMLTAFASFLFKDILGRRGIVIFTGLLMISPAMVFYSTYYIQESLLLCFSAFFMGAVWRYLNENSWRWALFAGISLGLMHATKETFVLAIFSFCCVLVLARIKCASFSLSENYKKHLLVFVVSTLLVSVSFYSSFFRNCSGPVDSVMSFFSHIHRAAGEEGAFPEHMTQGAGHTKPWHYYLHNIVGHYPRKYSSTVKDIWRNNSARPISEVVFLLLTLLGTFNFYKQKKSLPRRFYFLLLCYSAILFLLYSAIPYKTPWCMLSFLYGFIFCATLAIGELIKMPKSVFRFLGIIAVLFFSIDLCRQSAMINSENFAASQRNPYVYSHSVPAVEDLAESIVKLSNVDGRKFEMPIHFLTTDYWPMPWYLKRFQKMGYWEKRLPQFSLDELPIVITTPDREELCRRLENTHQMELFGRMPGKFLAVFYRRDLWGEMVSQRTESK